MTTRTPVGPPAPVDAAPVDAEAPLDTPRGGGHPRIRARRAEVARSAGRRRLRRANVVLAVVCAAVWTLVGLRSPLLDVDRVQVSGVERTSEAQVRAAAGLAPGDAMAELDLDSARRRVADLPWVRTAVARRLWPGTVRIVVVERQPLAAVRGPRGWSRVDADGHVLDRTSRRPPGLVALAGARSGVPGGLLAQADRVALSTLGRLPPALVADAVTARGDPSGLVLELADGFEVVIGDASDLRAKATAAVAVRRAADVARGCRIDVRVPTAPFLTPADTCG